MTFTKSQYSKLPEEFIEVRYENVLAFIMEMRKFSRTLIDDKEKDTWLWIPSIFDPAKGASGYRTEENFVASYFLVLDFDGGDLTPEAFEDIFWGKTKRGQRHPFIIHSTFNRRAENPNKFHVILPYKRPARSFEEHRAVYDYIVWRLEEAGHTEKSWGLITSPRPPTSPSGYLLSTVPTLSSPSSAPSGPGAGTSIALPSIPRFVRRRTGRRRLKGKQ